MSRCVTSCGTWRPSSLSQTTVSGVLKQTTVSDVKRAALLAVAHASKIGLAHRLRRAPASAVAGVQAACKSERRMRVCIVGASGKLGHYLVQHSLDRGYEVVGVCREQSVPKLDAFQGRMTILPGSTDDRRSSRAPWRRATESSLFWCREECTGTRREPRRQCSTSRLKGELDNSLLIGGPPYFLAVLETGRQLRSRLDPLRVFRA